MIIQDSILVHSPVDTGAESPRDLHTPIDFAKVGLGLCNEPLVLSLAERIAVDAPFLVDIQILGPTLTTGDQNFRKLLLLRSRIQKVFTAAFPVLDHIWVHPG